jgi:AcrR family transcriptional regulator
MSADAKGAPTKSARRRGAGATPEQTKNELIDAAFDTLRYDGFRGATARGIAGRASCNQAAIYYHFGGIDQLLIAALRRSSDLRLELYRERIEPITKLSSLVAEIERLYHDDRASGHLEVLAELMGGVTANPNLASGINESVLPWNEFVEAKITATAASVPLAAFVPASDIADLLLSLVVGIEMRTKVDDDTERAARLFGLVTTAASFLPD